LQGIPAIADDGTLYLGGQEGLTAVDAGGGILWTNAIKGVNAPPSIGADGTVLQVTRTGTLYAIGGTGHEKWRFTTGRRTCPNRASAAVGVDGAIYYACGRELHALTGDGRHQWQFDAPGVVRAPSIGVNGAIYVGSDRLAEVLPDTLIVHTPSRLFALHPDGTRSWEAELEGDVWASPAIDFEGILHMASEEWMYAFDADGEQLTRHRSGAIHTPIVGADGSIYVSMGDIHALDPDGGIAWRYESGGFAPPVPAIGVDGTIYAGGRDANDNDVLFAFEEIGRQRGGQRPSPWPQERGDWANTGRARVSAEAVLARRPGGGG
jgi:outer membrane protein assembly factor BamB